jgi:type II secretion system protein G
MKKAWAQQQRGFTIVELLIVIVIIGILAAITIVAYNGIQTRAKNTQRQSDIVTIAKALEVYYADKGQYPAGSGSTTINASWSTTADASWQNLVTTMRPYVSTLPPDPTSTPGGNVTGSTANIYNYAYYANTSTFCGAQPYQMYIIVYRVDGAQQNYFEGNCSTNVLYYGSSSNYRVVRS